MAKQEVEIVSKEILKPTLKNDSVDHPKTHTLSIFDQIVPAMYLPVIFFYNRPLSSSSVEESPTPSLLRATLAATLADFYPLAGRIRDGRVVDCNDEGVLFVEARVSGCSAREFLGENVSASDESLKLLGPEGGKFGPMEVCGSIPLAVQVTTFGGGGTAVFVSSDHSILDMCGFSYFLRTWAANAAAAASGGGSGGGILLPPPEFNISTIYPPVDELSVKNNDDIAPPPAVTAQPITVVKPAYARIVFDDSMIKALKQAARSEHVENPTANEAIAGLIYLTAIKAAAAVATANPNRTKDLMQPANLRSRVVPPLSEREIGNLVGYYKVGPTEESATLAGVVSEIRKAKTTFFDSIQAVDKEKLRLVTLDRAIKRLEEEEEEERGSSARVAEHLHVTNWCGFGLSEVDFGWGIPVAVTLPAPRRELVFNGINSCIMIDKKRGNEGGSSRLITVYVILEEAEMAAFLADEKLLAFGRVNPHPFD